MSVLSVTYSARKCFFPIYISIRWLKKKAKLKAYPPPYFKVLAMKATEPSYPDKRALLSITELCGKSVKAAQSTEKKYHPLEEIYANEIKDKLKLARLVAVFQQLPMKPPDLFEMKYLFFKNEMEYVYHTNNIITLALSNTIYEPMLKLYHPPRVSTVISNEIPIKKLIKVNQKQPSMVLLAAAVDGRLMSVSELKQYAELPPLPQLHAQFSSLITRPLQEVQQNITYHQREIILGLERYLKQANSSETNS